MCCVALSLTMYFSIAPYSTRLNLEKRYVCNIRRFTLPLLPCQLPAFIGFSLIHWTQLVLYGYSSRVCSCKLKYRIHSLSWTEYRLASSAWYMIQTAKTVKWPSWYNYFSWVWLEGWLSWSNLACLTYKNTVKSIILFWYFFMYNAMRK